MSSRLRQFAVAVSVLLLTQSLTGCFMGETAVRERAALQSWQSVIAAEVDLVKSIEAFGPTGLPADALPTPAMDETAPVRLPDPIEAEVWSERVRLQIAALTRLEGSLRAALGQDGSAPAKLRDVSRLLALSERIRAMAITYDRRAAAYNVARSGRPGRWWGRMMAWKPAQAGQLRLQASGQ